MPEQLVEVALAEREKGAMVDRLVHALLCELAPEGREVPAAEEFENCDRIADGRLRLLGVSCARPRWRTGRRYSGTLIQGLDEQQRCGADSVVQSSVECVGVASDRVRTHADELLAFLLRPRLCDLHQGTPGT